ncbi:MAG TPA: carbohydrate kinase family protein [Candidatus Bathyarchaeia archaeon]|nr:carbohydrate kinase family protein [Candidatus Bathyarchaeia archaeon]
MSEKDVIGLGALNYDVLYAVERIARGGEEVGIIDVKKVPGGSAANTIVALSRLGVEVGFVGMVGTDEEGELILDDFRKEGVETQIRIEEGYTGAAIGFVDAQGERALYIYPGVNEKLCMEDIDRDFINNARFLHTSSFVNKEQLEMQRELATRVKSKLSFSPGMLCFNYELEDLIAVIERSAVVFLSLDELTALVRGEKYDKGADVLLNIGAQIVCVTLGERGCYVTDSTGASQVIDAYPTDVVDTTGAGDAFAAGFLYGLLHEKDIQESGKLGNFVASSCIREYGARKGLPYNLSLEKTA